ncbi:DUF4349 domain-containing protein [Virgibacillus proomii]|uniref:DUF4349 domain-containing protein n=1 Tax=Virgibacillus proomii TaxID=84407 RepID=UPI000984ACD2|nr:DUF4349 domain-containing protein [Virgibacillus proomii]
MKKFSFCFLFILLVLVGCNDQTESDETSKQMAENIHVKNTTPIKPNEDLSKNEDASEQNETGENIKAADNYTASGRKIIYTATIQLEVKSFKQKLTQLEQLIDAQGGYIVDSTSHKDSEKGNVTGSITVRIPQKNFQSFMKKVETGEGKLMERSVSGEDVTEEFVDLEARLKSKKVVEKRLLSFMEQADKTEDLLDISDNLADVQEEIEQIIGRMNYLKNKADLATITIEIRENHTVMKGEDDLNTWDKTEQQFFKSMNMILMALSNSFVFIAGNIPIFLLIGMIIISIFVFIRNKRRNNQSVE